jgi:hypothetical protein
MGRRSIWQECLEKNFSPLLDIFSSFGYIYRRRAAVAQSVEQRTENPRVNSSILFGGTYMEADWVTVQSAFFMRLLQHLIRQPHSPAAWQTRRRADRLRV